MPGSKRKISIKTIELEIYKTFEQFKNQKNVSVATYLNKLYLSLIDDAQYRTIKFSYESLFKLILYKELKRIRFQTHLQRYLMEYPEDMKFLGLKHVPNQRTISYFSNSVLNDEDRRNIEYIVNKVETISEKFGILFDLNILKPDPPKPQAQRTLYHNKQHKTREISKHFKKRLSSVINLNLDKNSIYSKNDFINLLLHMCNTTDFAENGSHTYKLNQKKSPNGDTLLYHLKNYENLDQLKQMFIAMFEMIWENARQANHFSRTVDCSIDTTCWHYYGKDAPMVTEMKPDRGTNQCYKFATINISERNQRFTLLAIPVGPFDSREDILTTLINYARQRVRIRRLYVDRGFFDSKSIELFRRFNLKFLMPCSANERIKKILEYTTPPIVIKDYEMKHTRFNVVIVVDEFGNKRAFATNIDFNENDVGLADKLFLLYSKRWSIETSYRVKKHSFRPKTTSKNFLIRLFYFLFSVLLYNIWILIDILLCLALIGHFNGDHLITSKYFTTVLLSIDPGG